MRRLGLALLMLGLCGLWYAMTLDTTVPSRPYIETDQYGIAQRITPMRQHNLGLMNQKQNLLILFGALAVVGAVLTGRRSQ